MIELPSQRVIYAKNRSQTIYPASTTKIATALYSYKLLGSRLDELVTITKEMVGAVTPQRKRESNYTLPAHWIEVASNHMGLKVGEQISILDLLRGCLIASANDACNALALTAASSYSDYMEGLNLFVRDLGCRNTHFVNAHGLYHPKHVSTVEDLAILGQLLMGQPLLREIAGQRVFRRPKTNKQEPALLHHTNQLLHPGRYFCKWACGIKTGFTQQAGASVVSFATHSERTVLLVLSDQPNRPAAFEESLRLLRAAMSEPKVEQLFYRAGTLLPYKRRIAGAIRRLEVQVREDLKLATYPSSAPTVKGLVHWYELVPPIRKGQLVGRLELVDTQGEVLATCALIAAKDNEPSYLFQIRHWLWLHPGAGVAIGFALLIVLFKLRSLR